jgi:hypothetical protein
VLAVGLTGGCTSVRLMQRDDCWVRQKSRWPGMVKEEIGPCRRSQPVWAEDRLSRVVQECMTQADYRWQNRALEAWERGERLPERESDEEVLDRCMGESTRLVVLENEALKEQLADTRDEREKIRQSQTMLAEALGEAAKKPGTVTATASARGDGSSTTQHDAKTETAGYPPLVTMPVQAATTAKPVARAQRPAKPKPALPKCDPTPAVANKENEPAPVAAPAAPPAPAAPAPAVTPASSTKNGTQ